MVFDLDNNGQLSKNELKPFIVTFLSNITQFQIDWKVYTRTLIEKIKTAERPLEGDNDFRFMIELSETNPADLLAQQILKEKSFDSATLSTEAFERIFLQYDFNNDGEISKDELKMFLADVIE